LHQRVPFFCGSYNMVSKAEEFMKNSWLKDLMI
jgi:fructose-1,6-bisphosphatase I